MYLEAIVTLLKQELPNYSDNFSEKVAISSITHAAGTVTVVTTAVHGLSTNNVVTIVGVKQRTPITDITTVAGVAQVTTTIDHDLTLDYIDPSDQPAIEIDGTGIAAYDNTQTLDAVRSRRVFDFEVSGSPAQANTGYLLEDSPTGFSGVKTITVSNATTFTFTTTEDLPTTGDGGFVHSSIRISAEVLITRVLENYTKQLVDDFYLFAIPEDATASKSRHTLNDTTQNQTSGDDYRQRINMPFSLYLFIRTSNKLGGRSAYDDAITESTGIFKSIIGARIENPYHIDSFSSVIFEGHGFFDYNAAYYIHQFDFSFAFDLVKDDTIRSIDSVAFRDIDMYNKNTEDENILETLIDLDEEEV